MTYALVAIAFSAAISSSPTPPTISHVGEFDTDLACSAAARAIAQSVQNGPLQAAPPYTTPLRATMLLQCLPETVPGVCALDPRVNCGNDVPTITVFQPVQS